MIKDFILQISETIIEFVVFAVLYFYFMDVVGISIVWWNYFVWTVWSISLFFCLYADVSPFVKKIINLKRT